MLVSVFDYILKTVVLPRREHHFRRYRADLDMLEPRQNEEKCSRRWSKKRCRTAKENLSKKHKRYDVIVHFGVPTRPLLGTKEMRRAFGPEAL